MEQRLTVIASDVERALPCDALVKQWARLAVEVRLADTLPRGASGQYIPDPRRVVVEVRASEIEARQRFTVAHEVAHFLLADSRGAVRLQEESLCDRFASAVLVPNERLATYVDTFGLATVEDFVRLSRHFQASWGAVIVGLRPLLRSGSTGVLLARALSGKDGFAFSVIGFTGPNGVFIRRFRTLEALAFTNLQAAAMSVPTGQTVLGADLPRIESRTLPGHSGCPVSWSAQRFRGETPALIAVLQLSAQPYAAKPSVTAKFRSGLSWNNSPRLATTSARSQLELF